MSVAFPEYLWIVIVGCFCGFVYAFGIGANDVANSFASTVSSGSLTLKQAVIVAGIFEFSGAFFLGASVTGTIRSKIFDPEFYVGQEDIVMLGMFTSLMTGMIMLLVATHYGLPVSTTHTVVGCIMGFSIAAKGFESINWDVAVKIWISWAISPITTGLIAFIFFFSVRYFILGHENAFKRSYLMFPFVLLVGIGIDLFYVLFKGMNNLAFAESLSLVVVLPVSFGVGAICGLIWIFWVGPWAMKRIDVIMGEAAAEQEAKDNRVDEEQAKSDSDEAKATVDPTLPRELSSQEELEQAPPKVDNGDSDQEGPKKSTMARMYTSFAEKTFDQDLHHQSMHENENAAKIWDEAEEYDGRAELLFTYVQVFTACLNAFAHGANDVANAIAPISAILAIYQTGELSSKSPVYKWILAYGGVGIVFGLLLYGYKVMKSLGYKVTKLTPSRGAMAELASSLVVVTASFLSIPVSSTQCITGGVTGVGVVGGFKNVNWWFFGRICVGWVIIFFTSVILSAGIFSLLAYSPSLMYPDSYNTTTAAPEA